MEAYTGFASVYDLFMDNIPYKDWCAYVTGLLKEHGISDGLLLDLGCGTGKLTRLLAAAAKLQSDRQDPAAESLLHPAHQEKHQKNLLPVHLSRPLPLYKGR